MKKYKLLLFFFPLLIIACHAPKPISSTNPTLEETKIDTFILAQSPIGKELIEASIPFMGNAFSANSSYNCSYELNLLNTYKTAFKLVKVEIFSTTNDSIPISTYENDYLKKHFLRPGLNNDDEKLTLEPNGFGVLNIWLALETPPQQFYHQLTFEVLTRSGQLIEIPIQAALTNYPAITELSIGFPAKSGHWFYTTNLHRDARFLTEGKASFPQRYATDLVWLETDGTFITGDDIHQNTSYPTYGVELVAVADAEVVAILDSIPDNQPESDETAVRITRKTIAGNYIVLDIGHNIHAVYAHLIPNSSSVKVGDRVTKGQTIGLLGNSGNSTGPHLHFHLETRHKIPLGGEGVPYHFDTFTQLASYADNEIDTLFLGKKLPFNLKEPIIRKLELPIGNGILRID